MAKVPLIETQALSEFGDLRQSAEFYDPEGYDRDLTYVPGFSEMRRDHEVKKAAYFRGEANRDSVPVLPVNLAWVRSQTLKGDADNMKTFAQGRRGYRLATIADVGQAWFKELPGGAQQQPDGTIRNGDCLLMVADQKEAAKNELHDRLANERRLEGATGGFQRAIEEARRANPGLNVKGLDPTVEVLPQPEREASLRPQPVSVKRSDRNA